MYIVRTFIPRACTHASTVNVVSALAGVYTSSNSLELTKGRAGTAWYYSLVPVHMISVCVDLCVPHTVKKGCFKVFADHVNRTNFGRS